MLAVISYMESLFSAFKSDRRILQVFKHFGMKSLIRADIGRKSEPHMADSIEIEAETSVKAKTSAQSPKSKGV